jgi:hypothetical protein
MPIEGHINWRRSSVGDPKVNSEILAHCAQGGAAHSTLVSLAPELLAISQRIALDNGRLIPSAEVEIAADRWVRYQRRNQRILTGRFSRERFIQTATAWLRFLGRLQEQHPETPPFVDLVQRFDSYLREERGLSSHTIHNRCWLVQALLSWLSEQGSSIGEMRLERVDAFFALRRMQGLVPGIDGQPCRRGAKFPPLRR